MQGKVGQLDKSRHAVGAKPVEGGALGTAAALPRLPTRSHDIPPPPPTPPSVSAWRLSMHSLFNLCFCFELRPRMGNATLVSDLMGEAEAAEHESVRPRGGRADRKGRFDLIAFPPSEMNAQWAYKSHYQPD